MIKEQPSPVWPRLCKLAIGRRWPALGMVLALGMTLALGVLLTACKAWIFDDAQLQPQTIEVTDDMVPDPSYPNLSSVPDQVPRPSPTAQRSDRIVELSADRQSARYSSDPLLARSAALEDDPAYPPAPTLAGRDGGSQVAGVPAPAYGAGRLIGLIYFDHGSVGLSQRDREVLRQVAALQQAEGRALRVVGHASSSSGTANAVAQQSANMTLSLQRARAVAAALSGFGVDSSRIGVEGFGDAQPAYSESAATGEAGNRRVEIFLE